MMQKSVVRARVQRAPVGSSLREGTMTIIPVGDIRIHSYRAPETGVFANTQIIETRNRLVIVDTQFLRAHAEEVRRYADDIGKPIDRVIVTHSHPDHWFGSEWYPDTPVHALQEVAEEIRQGGEAMIQQYGSAFGDAVTKEKVIPTHAIAPGPETIDGLDLVYTRVEGAESTVNLVIELPGQRVLAGQDLLFNRVHAFLRQKDLGPWRAEVHRFMEKQYDLVLVGHGLPGNMQVLADLERYLTDAQMALSKSSDIQSLKAMMQQMYPYYQGASILDISGSYLYPPKS